MEDSSPNGHINDHSHAEHAQEHETIGASADTPATEMSNRDKVVTTAATIGVVGVAAIVFEAALIPGMILGVAAALAPSYIPRLGAAFNPLFRSTVRGAYRLGQKTKEAASEVREQVSDIVAEVNTEASTVDKTKAL